jgi:hypothetical protein
MMQKLSIGLQPGKASIFYMPFTDMPASDETCIKTTLNFIAEQAKKYGFPPIVTFDQPLFWKAFMILKEESRESDLFQTILKLGGFHIIISFVGAIGHSMDGSGLRELLEVIYAKDTVPHMLSGKAISRALRALFLVDSALHTLLLDELFSSNDGKSFYYPLLLIRLCFTFQSITVNYFNTRICRRTSARGYTTPQTKI